MGEIVKTPSGREYKVTGVYEDMPNHSHLIAEAMISMNTLERYEQFYELGRI